MKNDRLGVYHLGGVLKIVLELHPLPEILNQALVVRAACKDIG